MACLAAGALPWGSSLWLPLCAPPPLSPSSPPSCLADPVLGGGAVGGGVSPPLRACDEEEEGEQEDADKEVEPTRCCAGADAHGNGYMRVPLPRDVEGPHDCADSGRGGRACRWPRAQVGERAPKEAAFEGALELCMLSTRRLVYYVVNVSPATTKLRTDRLQLRVLKLGTAQPLPLGGPMANPVPAEQEGCRAQPAQRSLF